jgi:hypothetical protein
MQIGWHLHERGAFDRPDLFYHLFMLGDDAGPLDYQTASVRMTLFCISDLYLGGGAEEGRFSQRTADQET